METKVSTIASRPSRTPLPGIDQVASSPSSGEAVDVEAQHGVGVAADQVLDVGPDRLAHGLSQSSIEASSQSSGP